MSVVTTREIPRNYWWLVLLRGIISVLFGIVAIVWPGPTLLFLIYLFGAYVLIDGITAVVVAFQERNVYSRWWVI
ncbi:MAG: HdeD family acid-resistance protein, partial [Chloroflexi bacterium]